jgi:uncharacterized ion transporter superfamily protein YfcC
VLLFSVIVVAAIASYIVPAGQYERELVNGRNIVVPGSYAHIESTPISPFAIFTSIHDGMVGDSAIIFYVVVIGGTIAVVNSTGAINAFLLSATEKLAKRQFLFVAITMLLFSLGGSFIGMAEESLMYIPIVIPISLALGFDVITGTAIVLFGMGIGFTTAIANPFTVGIAQSISEVTMYSGIEVRILIYCIFYILAVGFVYRYGKKVQKNPELGFFGDGRYKGLASEIKVEFTTRHKLVLISFVLAICVIVCGTIKFDWYMAEMSGTFFILIIIVALIAKMPINDMVKEFLNGASGIIAAALVVGLARGIVVVLTNGHIIDSILYGAANVLETVPSSLSAGGMFIVQALIHFLVPSGTGQAMLTMPIMAPLSDLVGVTRQTACLVFTLADGTGNTLFPTSGYFMAALAVAGIPWQKWVKVFIPLIGMQYAIGIISVIVANAMNYGG